MKNKWLFLIALLAVLGIAVFIGVKLFFPLVWQRVRIPESPLSIQIPVGYEYIDGNPLLIMDELDSIDGEPTYPVFWIFPTRHTDAYREYQSPEDVIAKIFQGTYSEPIKQTINGVDVYVVYYTGTPSQDEVDLVKALFFYENQYITFDAVGYPSEAETISQLADAMLNSLSVNNP